MLGGRYPGSSCFYWEAVIERGRCVVCAVYISVKICGDVGWSVLHNVIFVLKDLHGVSVMRVSGLPFAAGTRFTSMPCLVMLSPS